MNPTTVYLEQISHELNAILLQGKDGRNEDSLHHFFEKYPVALLSAIGDAPANYHIYCGCIISKPNIKSLDGDRQPDFLIVTSNSLNLYFNFIEIESSDKKIFRTSDQSVTADFSQAYNQLKQWSSFENDEIKSFCNDLLDSLFKDNYDSRTVKKHHYNYILVYGSVEEIENQGKRCNDILQSYFEAKNLYHCTYSRIRNNIRFYPQLFTVRKEQKSNKYKAVGLVPIRHYGIDEWMNFHNISGKSELIHQTNLLADDEKKILLEEIAHWDAKSYQQIHDEMFKNGLQIRNLSALKF